MVITTYDKIKRQWTVERDGSVIAYLDWDAAMSVFHAFERECFKEDLRARIDEAQDDDGSYWIGSHQGIQLSDDDIEKLIEITLDDFIEGMSNSESWVYVADRCLGENLEKVLK